MAYLTKSRFKIGLECPTKLFYDSNRKTYKNQQQDDPFMQALAKGGFQVGELAKLYYPGGIDIETLNIDEAIRLTEEALKKDEVTIFEAAIKVGHKFIRVDILQKTKNQIRLIEVKSKSANGNDESQLLKKDGAIDSGWRPYLEDVAFQYCLVKEYFQNKNINLPVKPYLMLTDKTAQCSVNDLHQQFLLLTDKNGRSYCQPKKGITRASLGNKILVEINAQDAVEILIDDTYYGEKSGWKVKGFRETIQWFEELLISYENGGAAFHFPIGAQCENCQFKTLDHKNEGNLKSGYKECFVHNNWKPEDLLKPMIWDVWDFRKKKRCYR